MATYSKEFKAEAIRLSDGKRNFHSEKSVNVLNGEVEVFVHKENTYIPYAGKEKHGICNPFVTSEFMNKQSEQIICKYGNKHY